MSVKFKLGSIKIGELAAAVKGEAHYFGSADENTECVGIDIDSRNIGDGDIFVAIKGERVDGNDYIPSAVEKGAVCIIASSVPDNVKGIEGAFAVVVCDSPVDAVGDLAHEYKKKN